MATRRNGGPRSEAANLIIALVAYGLALRALSQPGACLSGGGMKGLTKNDGNELQFSREEDQLGEEAATISLR